MGPFATNVDVEARWRPLTTEEAFRAGVLLDDASNILRAEYPDIDARIISGSLAVSVAAQVVAAMVIRAMSGPGDGVKAATETTGPYSSTMTYTDEAGQSALYLTGAERLLLGGHRTPIGGTGGSFSFAGTD